MTGSKIFILLGPPGAGKGTLSSLCVQHFGWEQLSTGNLCRDHLARATPLGLQMKELIAAGQLVPDEIIIGFVVDWFVSQEKLPSGILLDGTPRTEHQASVLYDVFKAQFEHVEMVVVKLQIDPELLVKRIVHRVTCSNKNCGQVYSSLPFEESSPKVEMICDHCGSALVRRSDDTAESLQQRLRVYYENEQAIIDFYVDKGLPILTLNGAQPISTMFEKFKELVLRDYGC